MIEKINKIGKKLIVTVNKDLSINKPFKNQVPNELGYIGLCLYEEEDKKYLDLWIKENESFYEYIEKYREDIVDAYLHHEILHILGYKKVIRLKEVIDQYV